MCFRPVVVATTDGIDHTERRRSDKRLEKSSSCLVADEEFIQRCCSNREMNEDLVVSTNE